MVHTLLISPPLSLTFDPLLLFFGSLRNLVLGDGVLEHLLTVHSTLYQVIRSSPVGVFEIHVGPVVQQDLDAARVALPGSKVEGGLQKIEHTSEFILGMY